MVKTIAVIGLLSLTVAFNSNAQDVDRVAQLEKEVQELKYRVSKLESMLNKQGSVQEIATSADGWKSVANWRKLATGMNESEVRAILGEPERIDGGGVARWQYQNRGGVTFISGKLQQWSEPRN